MDAMDGISNKGRRERKIIPLPGIKVLRHLRTLEGLHAENRELRIRVASLVRLLMSQGVFSAEAYATMVADTRARIVGGGSERGE
jgi:hypothetical protein